MSEKMTPEIRFRGFQGEWEDKAFVKIAVRLSVACDNPILPNVEYEDIVSGENRLNKDIRKKRSHKKGLFFSDKNVLFGKLRPYLRNYFMPTFEGIAVGDFWVLDPLENDRTFIFALIQGDLFQITANISAGSKMPRSDWNTVANTPFSIPKTLKEQKRIGSVFSALDRTIDLQRRKLEKLQTFKSSMLQKLFPKEGSLTPEIRFRGFEGEWRRISLGEIGNARSGIGFPEKEQGGKTGIPFFKVSDMNTEGNEIELLLSNNYVSKEQILRNRWQPIESVPAVFFAKVGAAVMLNRKRLIRSPFLLDNNTMAYSFDCNEWNAEFGAALFEKIDLTALAQVGALPSFNVGDLESLRVCLPDKHEQKRIGALFATLDRTIDLQRRKLEKLQNLKQSLLQKMFV